MRKEDVISIITTIIIYLSGMFIIANLFYDSFVGSGIYFDMYATIVGFFTIVGLPIIIYIKVNKYKNEKKCVLSEDSE